MSSFIKNPITGEYINTHYIISIEEKAYGSESLIVERLVDAKEPRGFSSYSDSIGLSQVFIITKECWDFENRKDVQEVLAKITGENNG